MSHETFVAKIPRAGFGDLERRIGAGPFEFRSVPHAAFSAKGEGVVVTLYNSGKLVVQGGGVTGFLARYTDLDGAPRASAAASKKPRSGRATDAEILLDPPVTGSDEAGKGDYFGPLVVAAVRADEGALARLAELKVADSKTLTDPRALKLGALLREGFQYAIRRVDPAEYNEVYPTYSGLNPFLADLHAEVLGQLAGEGENVVVDQFERRGLVRTAVHEFGVKLTEVPRAERHVAVAAASILARQEFLVGMRELSEELGVDLHKGAGAPVDKVGVRIVREHGEGALRGVAKLHFKNTGKILARV